MRRMFSALILAAAAICFLSAAPPDSRTLYVSSPGAVLKAEPAADAETVISLAVGDAVSVEKAEGSWYRVRTDADDTGWIYRGKLAEQSPETELPPPDDLLGDLDDSGILLAAADTARSIRGRRDGDGESRPGADISPEDAEALNRILTFYVGPEELETFLREGRIGEYAR
jgi:hypothetical protein